MTWIMEHYDEIIAIVAGIITVASIIVKLTPTPKDDTILAKVMSVFEFLSLNKKTK